MFIKSPSLSFGPALTDKRHHVVVFWWIFPLDVDIICEIRRVPVGRMCCKICNADTSLHLAWHGAALNINSLQLAIYHQLFPHAASNLSPHSVIYFFFFFLLYGLVAASRRGGTDGGNLFCGAQSFIFYTGPLRGCAFN